VAYWHYGLINFIALSELLRARSHGAIDLLAGEEMRRIAAYPAKMLLSGPWFASFSDCDEQVSFNPGLLARMADRTGDSSLRGLLAHPERRKGDWRLTMMLRNILWWDAAESAEPEVADALLPVGGVARLAARASDGAMVVLAAKAGHNAEHHNQNDIGSFIVHVDGENLLTDPGRGLYSRFYFGPLRYENIFANSYGHSVPRIGGQLQKPGAEFRGQLLGVERHANGSKEARIELARAYGLEGLETLERELLLTAGDGQASTITLHDRFSLSGTPIELEEALVTWYDVDVDGPTAFVRGQRHGLRLTIEQPPGVSFRLEQLEEQSRANGKPGVLKRLCFRLPAGATETSVRMEIVSL
jgi:hypothetical protein